MVEITLIEWNQPAVRATVTVTSVEPPVFLCYVLPFCKRVIMHFTFSVGCSMSSEQRCAALNSS